MNTRVRMGAAVMWLCFSAFAEQRQMAGAEDREIKNATASGGIESVIDDLSTAQYGEVNSHWRYLAFAATADTEGYGQVASMFRAVGRGDEIHAGRIAALLSSFGIKSQPASEP